MLLEGEGLPRLVYRRPILVLLGFVPPLYLVGLAICWLQVLRWLLSRETFGKFRDQPGMAILAAGYLSGMALLWPRFAYEYIRRDDYDVR